MEVDINHGIHITEMAGSCRMSSENWQINLKVCQTRRSQSSDAFRSIWSSSVTRAGTEPASGNTNFQQVNLGMRVWKNLPKVIVQSFCKVKEY